MRRAWLWSISFYHVSPGQNRMRALIHEMRTEHWLRSLIHVGFLKNVELRRLLFSRQLGMEECARRATLPGHPSGSVLILFVGLWFVIRTQRCEQGVISTRNANQTVWDSRWATYHALILWFASHSDYLNYLCKIFFFCALSVAPPFFSNPVCGVPTSRYQT